MAKKKIKLSGIKKVPGALFSDVKSGIKKTSSKWKHTPKSKRKAILWSAGVIGGSLFLAWLLAGAKKTYDDGAYGDNVYEVQKSELEGKTPIQITEFLSTLSDQGYIIIFADDVIEGDLGDDELQH